MAQAPPTVGGIKAPDGSIFVTVAMSQPANGDHIARLSRQQLRSPIKPWHPPLVLPGSRQQQPRKRQRSASPTMQQAEYGTVGGYVDPVTGHSQEHFVKVLGTRHSENSRFAYKRLVKNSFFKILHLLRRVDKVRKACPCSVRRPPGMGASRPENRQLLCLTCIMKLI